jgi:hypothetical protein
MKKEKYVIPQETIDSLVKLGDVLQKIHTRMKKEGFEIVDSQIRSIETGEVWKPIKK